MIDNVIPFHCHRFSKADLAFLANLLSRLTTAGLISDYERHTAEEPPHADLVVITLPGAGSPRLSVERRSDGVYWLTALGQGEPQALTFGRTVDKVCSQLSWWVRTERPLI